MRIQFPLYTDIAIVVCIIMLWMIVELWRAARRRYVVGAQEHAFLSALVLWWFAIYTLEVSSVQQGIAIFFLRLQFIGFMFLPVAWLAFVAAVRAKPFKPLHLVLLGLIPFSTSLLAWTPAEWGIIYRNIVMTEKTPFLLSYGFSPAFKLALAYVIASVLAGIILLLWHMRHARKRQRQRMLFVVISLAVPTLFSFVNLFILLPSGIIFPFDVSPSISLIAALGISWALLRIEVFELLPIARDVVMENLREGVLVLDSNKRVIDSNRTTHQLLNLERDALMAENETPQILTQLLAPLELSSTASGTESHEQPYEEGRLKIEEERRYQLELNARHIDVTVSPFYQRKRYRGSLFLLRDISQEIEASRKLHSAYQHINTLNTQLAQENKRLSTELDVARQIQALVLPNQYDISQLQQRHHLDIAVAMTPAYEVSGDYYDMLEVDDGLIFAIGDVTGHGLESGIVMLMVQSDLRILLNHGERDIGKMLASLNTSLYQNMHSSNNEADFYKTLSLSLLYYHNDGVCSLSGQHEELIILKASGEIQRKDTLALGFPIGLEKDISQLIQQETFQFEAGDSLIFFTDGITEAENDQGERYELARLLECIAQLAGSSAGVIKQAVMEDVRHYCGGQAFLDDVTLMVIQKPSH